MPSLNHVELKPHSYYKTGGFCHHLHQPTSLQELAEVLSQVERDHKPYFILGAGSNSLIMDEEWPGSVISFSHLNRLRVEQNTLYCEAGVTNTQIAETALAHKLSGASWMYRLPGQIGATVRMNARCYGGEISQIVNKIWAVDPKMGSVTYDKIDRSVFKAYKDTIFMSNQQIVGAVQIKLEEGEPAEIKGLMDHCSKDRQEKKQFEYPTCGCIFKNDYSKEVSVSTGLLLELAGAARLSVGHASVSPHHCNFIYNKGASSGDILELSLQMRHLVWEKFGVWLNYEMEILGKIPEQYSKRIYESRTPKYKTEALQQARILFKEKLTKRNLTKS